MSITKEEINALSLEEKQQLLEMIWDSMEDKNNFLVHDGEAEEPEAELQLLHERLEEYRRDPSTAIPWQEAFEKLKEA